MTQFEPQSSATVAPIAVELKGARLSHGGREIFRALDLSLAPGTTTCLLGPSGIGKTSLLRLIAGLTAEAEVEALGDGDGAPLTGRLAYMDQRDLLLPWLRLRDNVALGARLRGERADRARVDVLLAAVGLTAAAEARPAELSGGMKQRAALARTLMEDRALVLMDEPFSALDALNRLKLQDLAARLLAGRTVLLVTHDPMEALRLGHRILVLSGEPASLRELPPPGGEPPRRATATDLHERMIELLNYLGVDRTEDGA